MSKIFSRSKQHRQAIRDQRRLERADIDAAELARKKKILERAEIEKQNQSVDPVRQKYIQSRKDQTKEIK